MKAPLGAYTMGSATTRTAVQTNGHISNRSSIDLSRTENHLLQKELAEFGQCASGDGQFSAYCSGTNGEAADSKLLDSLAKFFNNYFNPVLPVAPTQIAPATGGTAALDGLLRGICDPGDGILVSGPCWHSFDPGCWASSSLQTIVVNVPTFNDTFTTKLISALTDAINQPTCRIKALLLSNPHMPFGQCYPLEVLEACVKFCNKHNIHYITDEVYALTSFPCAEITDPAPFISALSLNARALGCEQSRIHMMWSISKDFGATGFHMGCTITQGNNDLVARLTKASKSQISAGSAAFTTTLLSSRNFPFLIALNSARLAESYIIITSFFLRHNINYIPANTGLSIFARLAPNAKTWDDEATMVTRLKDAGVLVSAGRHYHGVQREKGWARLSFSLEKDCLQEALRRVERALSLR